MKLDTKISIGVIGAITILVISYFLYVKYHVVTYTKAEFIDANWKCSSYVNKPTTYTACNPLVINNTTTIVCSPQTTYNKTILATLNGNGINYQCANIIDSKVQIYYDLSFNLKLKIFESKEIIYTLDNYQEASELVNRKKFIVGLNKDFEVVNYK